MLLQELNSFERGTYIRLEPTLLLTENLVHCIIPFYVYSFHRYLFNFQGILIFTHHIFERHYDKKKAQSALPASEKTALRNEDSVCPNGDIDPCNKEEKKRPSMVEMGSAVVFAGP